MHTASLARTKLILGSALAGSLLIPVPACAAGLDGRLLGFAWALPFAGLLLSIALWPLLAPQFWHRHFGKLTCAWSLAFLLPCIAWFGLPTASTTILHAVLSEYLPFIILITALFVVAGGICVRGNLHGTPWRNTGLLALGTLLASVMGTTGAAILMIRPLIRANDNRRHTVHIVVFFIFLVANAGGALTPIGDPPLFLGFLQGVDFFWPLKNILLPTLMLCCCLLLLFFALDYYYFHQREEAYSPSLDQTPDSPVWLEGKVNLILLACIVGLVLMSGLWQPLTRFSLAGVEIGLPGLVRDILLIGVIVVSLKLTPTSARLGNEFSWGPIQEVGKLFAGIFFTIAPVIAMLRAGEGGAFAFVHHAVNDSTGQPINWMYFWTTGLLSSFLDNAPTYLVFFNAAGGDPSALMGPLATTLAAISCGAVFMGAVTYIGNAPNMMVRAIAEERGIRMPSFFGYMVWSCALLLPLFILLSWIFFR